MNRPFLWIQLVLAALVVLGVWLQVYFIASYFFGAADALDVHKTIGEIMRGVEVLVFLAALGAWWRNWGKIGHAFGLAAVGTIQIALSGGDDWVGGFHGLLALAILVMAVFIVKDDAEALGLTRGRGDAGAAPPRPLP
jgi:peptidoglycan/LPS O-acetylase OafA/YrhL